MYRGTLVLFFSMVIVATAQTPTLTEPGGIMKIDITEHSDHSAGGVSVPKSLGAALNIQLKLMYSD